MDYKKKYKEALERARIYRDNAKAVEEYSAVARYENIFPELQEKKTLCEGCIHSRVCKVMPFSQESLISCSGFQEKWKPSEKQMNALRNVAYAFGNSCLSPYSISNKALASLYEQLKKL